MESHGELGIAELIRVETAMKTILSRETMIQIILMISVNIFSNIMNIEINVLNV